MKNIKAAFSILMALSITVVSFYSCEDSENTIDQVVDGTTTGAVLRKIEDISNTLNNSLPDSAWGVVVEEQDEQDGRLLKSVDVYVSIKDLTPDNGTTVANDFFIKSIDASEFTAGPNGLPRASITATFGESVAAMGLTSDQNAPGDLFVYELRLNLTDGRTYGASSAAGIITGGFFSSSFLHNAGIVCAPKPGDYRIDMHDSYGDGWQTNDGNGGSGITIKLTDADGNESVIEFGMCSQYATSTFLSGSECVPNDGSNATTTVTIPVGTQTAIWEFPGDRYGEISFEIYAPDGSLLLGVPEGEGAPGLLAVTNCL